ncbi:RNA polymerase sigma factor [Micromonospora chersina]|uniref:RNA polymerase sigma factor n=1 Tax=Micromonospora chersina TaxID=47854 RepID=UPI003722DAEB
MAPDTEYEAQTALEDSSALGRRFRDGDEAALAEVYRSYSGAMFAAAFTLLGNRELAADAVQQAFVQAWRAASRFDPSRELRPWLYAITRRAAVDVHRRNRRGSLDVPLDESWSAEADTATDGPSMDTLWLVWQVREALDRLPPDERLVVQLAYHQGMTQSEVAEALDIPLGTVKSRTSRAHRKLARLLAYVRDTTQAEGV